MSIIRADNIQSLDGNKEVNVFEITKQVTSLSGLQSLVPDATKTNVAAMVDTPRAGTFWFDSSDLSTEVSNDEVTPGEGDGGIYVAPDSDKTGASGAWVRQFIGPVYSSWYDGDIDTFIKVIETKTGHYVFNNSPSFSNQKQIRLVDESILEVQHGHVLEYTGARDQAGLIIGDPASTLKFAKLVVSIEQNSSATPIDKFANVGISLVNAQSCDVDFQTSGFYSGAEFLADNGGNAWNKGFMRSLSGPGKSDSDGSEGGNTGVRCYGINGGFSNENHFFGGRVFRFGSSIMVGHDIDEPWSPPMPSGYWRNNGNTFIAMDLASSVNATMFTHEVHGNIVEDVRVEGCDYTVNWRDSAYSNLVTYKFVAGYDVKEPPERGEQTYNNTLRPLYGSTWSLVENHKVFDSGFVADYAIQLGDTVAIPGWASQSVGGGTTSDFAAVPYTANTDMYIDRSLRAVFDANDGVFAYWFRVDVRNCKRLLLDYELTQDSAGVYLLAADDTDTKLDSDGAKKHVFGARKTNNQDSTDNNDTTWTEQSSGFWRLGSAISEERVYIGLSDDVAFLYIGLKPSSTVGFKRASLYSLDGFPAVAGSPLTESLRHQPFVSATLDPGSVSKGDTYTTNVSHALAYRGAIIHANFDDRDNQGQPGSGWDLSAKVVSDQTVEISLTNNTGSDSDPGTFDVRAFLAI